MSLDVNVDKSQLLSTNDVATLMEQKHGVKLSPRTILDYVKQGRAGQPLKKRGPNPAFLYRWRHVGLFSRGVQDLYTGNNDQQ